MGYDDRNGITTTGHLQWLSAICGEQLSKQGTVIVSTETLEKPHDFIHKNYDTTLIVVVDPHHGLLCEVGENGLHENWFVGINGIALVSGIQFCIAFVLFNELADHLEVMFLEWTKRIVKWWSFTLSGSSYQDDIQGRAAFP